MSLETLINTLGEGETATIAGLLVGLGFGALAQRSRFCLRAAAIEFWRGSIGPKVAIWLLAFGAAVAGTQLFIYFDLLDVAEARQLANPGSLSGAIIGGAMFGVGMILSRGCASRLLVLSATGNLRALMTGLILTLFAQASLNGGLSPLREALAGLWMVDGGPSRDLIAQLGLNSDWALAFGLICVAAALLFALRSKVSGWVMIGAAGVGGMIAVGWFTTYAIASLSFSPESVKSISFIGPSADTLMAFVNQPSLPLGFDLGMVPGVFVGSFLAALLARDLKLECFSMDMKPMPRYLAGAGLMGFGGMLAGGCAVGAGVTGGAVFALTAWVALTSMWVAAGITDYLVDLRRERAEQASIRTLAPAE